MHIGWRHMEGIPYFGLSDGYEYSTMIIHICIIHTYILYIYIYIMSSYIFVSFYNKNKIKFIIHTHSLLLRETVRNP